MIAPAPAREIVRLLKKSGFTPTDAKGSHTKWSCPTGKHVVSVPDGHKTVSPGVHRQVRQTIGACNCDKERP